MAQARQAMMNTYGNDLLSHPTQNNQDYKAPRYNNTFKSSALNPCPDNAHVGTSQAKRDKIFQSNPLATKVARASYQDSNIFGTKQGNNETVQTSCSTGPKQVRERGSNTFNSNVFTGSQDKAVKERQQNTFNSNVFGGPTDNPVNRKKLGGESSGTENLFGSAKCDYSRSNEHNQITSIRKTEKKEPRYDNRPQTADQRKAAELHGRSALAYGTNPKKDGALMSTGTDWRNSQVQTTNMASPTKGANMDKGTSHKDKKYQNLQSSAFGDSERPAYNKDQNSKISFASNSDWKTEAGMARPKNKGSTTVDTFGKRQQQLSSQVFEQSDYQGYAPLSKKKIDMDNLTSKKKQADHLYSDVLPQTVYEHQGKTVKGKAVDKTLNPDQAQKIDNTGESYQVKSQKQNMLQSAFDTHSYAPPPKQAEQPNQEYYEVPVARATQSNKMRDLSSNTFGGESTLKNYEKAQNSKSEIIHLELSNLPENMQAAELKRMSGAKHVISSSVAEDNFRGVCTGTGSVQIRLNAGETPDSVKLNYIKAGYIVKEHAQDSRKKPALTQAHMTKTKNDQGDLPAAKGKKQDFLASQNPDVFGNSGAYQPKQKQAWKI